METINKIKNLIEKSQETEIQKSILLWVENYKISENIELPIAIFITEETDYLFITGTTTYKLKRKYKEMTDFDTIAQAIWRKYTNQ